ncbi:aldo/keto reductase [Prosthecobacter sp.]|uniref:aldo/keto reductase n=1 Tax=Prosthecobacter sp. TaxID=1965333 RepID=UPI001D9A7629|nr:aldo/keto reductase [Prosthecobacter sp.]MCB1276586.1 aldo/keto reductase [Prosthecobacter sp.]
MKGRSQIGLGCVTFGREIGESASFALLDHALAQGVRHFDTAAAYGQGASETIVGRWLASRKPEGVTVATKVLPPYDRIDIRGSLQRLSVEQIDLLYLHQWHETALQAGTALDELVRSGQVKALGVCNVTLDQLKAAGPRYSFVQNNHNLAVSDVSEAMRDYCAANDIDIVTYSPLGAGFLTSKHQDGVKAGSRFDLVPGHQDVYFHESAYRRLAKLEAVAGRTGHSQAHLALAWALHQTGIATVLVGGRTPAHLDQAFDALAFNDPALFAELTQS